jgi:hypothetical protein
MRRSLALFNLLIINFTHGQFEEVVDDSLILFNGTLGVLEANRSVIQNAQFDWSLGWFRLAGMAPRYKRYYLGVLSMNSAIEGAIDWNRWGGLNDLTRYPNQNEWRGNINYSGGVAGYSAIDPLNIGGLGPMRLTLSRANRSYRNRIMLTTTFQKEAFDGVLSASHRGADEGYYNHTPYHSTSLFAQARFRKGSFRANGFLIGTRTNRLSPEAHTEEVWSLVSPKFYSSWGYQNQVRIPFKQKNHRHLQIQSSLELSYPKGVFRVEGMSYKRSLARHNLSYSNAPSPYLTYYKYLPSYFQTKPFQKARLIGLLDLEGGIDFERLYRANQESTEARYYLSSDNTVASESIIGFYWEHQEGLNSLSFRIQSQSEKVQFYKQLEDLLGASYYLNYDTFNKIRYDLSSPLQKVEGENIDYSYLIGGNTLSLGLNYQKRFPKWELSYHFNYSNTRGRRKGLMKYEFEKNDNEINSGSIGKHHEMLVTANLSPKHNLSLTGTYSQIPYPLDEHWVNPRVLSLAEAPTSQTYSRLLLEYRYRYRLVSFDFYGFTERQRHLYSRQHFYADADLWANLVTQTTYHPIAISTGWLSNLTLNLTSEIELSATVYSYRNRYRSNGQGLIYFPPTSSGAVTPYSMELLSDNLVVASGPSNAFTLGVCYQHPQYWSFTLKAIGLGGTHLEPEWPKYNREFLEELKRYTIAKPQQQQLEPLTTLHFLASKSWKTTFGYLQLFFSANNILNRIQPIAGYGSSRLIAAKDYAQDLAQGVFSSKTWRSQGLTYFLNLSFKN